MEKVLARHDLVAFDHGLVGHDPRGRRPKDEGPPRRLRFGQLRDLIGRERPFGAFPDVRIGARGQLVPIA